ncbi:heme lyase NrfEFG subunit NrfF [Pasteurella testudinis]|uniref:heme lyase NrfEFG subunit NrfF n=1 Tax=Pasteurella testudinis TaxID=761 RepID=UPI00405A09EB
MWRQFSLWLLLCFSFSLSAEIVDTYAFQSPEVRARAVNLAKSLRCPQCQNQNLVESNSPIAYDLRLEVYKMVDAGDSDQQIIEQMTARFGDFVRYDPPFKTTTLLLWLTPFVLLILALGGVWHNQAAKKSHLQAQTTPDIAIQNKLESAGQSAVNTSANVLHLTVLPLLIVLSAVLIYAAGPRYAALQQGVSAPRDVIQSSVERGQQQTLEQLQHALSADYNNGENWYQLGLLYLQSEQYANALESFSRAEYLLGARSELLASAATALYYQSGQKLNDKAKSWLALALQQEPQQKQALSLLAADAFAQGDYRQAAQHWRRILASNSADLDRRNVIQNLQAAEMLGKMQP